MQPSAGMGQGQGGGAFCGGERPASGEIAAMETAVSAEHGTASSAAAGRMEQSEAEEAVEVFVCQARTCRAHGSEAMMTEIEELGKVVAMGCSVKATGCVGYCSQAPNAIVRKHGGTARETIEVETQIRSLEASAKVVERATGTRPRLEDPEMSGRFARLRAQRAREHAREVSHWNAALQGLEAACEEQPELVPQLEELRGFAGFKDGVVSDAMPKSVKDYTRWSLEAVTAVSKHSAVCLLRGTHCYVSYESFNSQLFLGPFMTCRLPTPENNCVIRNLQFNHVWSNLTCRMLGVGTPLSAVIVSAGLRILADAAARLS